MEQFGCVCVSVCVSVCVAVSVRLSVCSLPTIRNLPLSSLSWPLSLDLPLCSRTTSMPSTTQWLTDHTPSVCPLSTFVRSPYVSPIAREAQATNARSKKTGREHAAACKKDQADCGLQGCTQTFESVWLVPCKCGYNLVCRCLVCLLNLLGHFAPRPLSSAQCQTQGSHSHEGGTTHAVKTCGIHTHTHTMILTQTQHTRTHTHVHARTHAHTHTSGELGQCVQNRSKACCHLAGCRSSCSAACSTGS